MKHVVTAALPYVNNTPHLGNLVQVLSADVYARYKRLDDDVLFVCGTDEHGTTTELIAREKDVSPRELVDYYYKRHKHIYDWFNCSFDCFGRTSSQENIERTQALFQALDDNGYIDEQTTTQLYDQQADQFLPDRYVEGTCPECGYDDADGDQCEQCGALLEPTDLVNPKSTITDETPVERETTHLYIKLDELQDKVEDHFDDVNDAWSTNAVETTKAWFNDGLESRAITRDLDWGVPVPKDGFQDKVFYVWFDAPIGYISITEEHRDDWQSHWQGDDIHLTQFMGKDNIPFHSVMFPATLLGADDDWHVIDTLESNEYLNYEDKQFSKSNGVGVFGDDAMQTGIPADSWRYYVIRNRPAKSDTTFTWDDFQEKHNAELIGCIANLVNRVVGYAANEDLDDVETRTGVDYDDTVDDITGAYDNRRLKVALDHVLRLARNGNEYFQQAAPWEASVDEDEERRIVANTLTLIKDLSIVLHPVCPDTAQTIQDQIGYTEETALNAIHETFNASIDEAEPIFDKVDDDTLMALQDEHDEATETPGIELTVGTITDVTIHDDADNLYVETVDLGSETRQVVSGLRPYYDADELDGCNVVIVSNLEPAELRGVKSEGMLLAIDTDDEVSVITADNYEAGDTITYESITPAEDITFEDFKSLDLRFDDTLLINGEHHMQSELLGNLEGVSGPVR